MKYIHYTEFPFVLEKRTYKQELGRKPTGLWFSAESGNPDDWNWEQHCYYEEIHQETFEYKTEIIIRSDGNLLILDTIEKIREFSNQYGVYDEQFGIYHLSTPNLEVINWQGVASEYQGIVIAPYHRTLIFELICGWYYGWDCASGCIWDLDAIEKVVCIRTEF